MNRLCKRIFWDLPMDELPKELERKFQIEEFTDILEEVWKGVNYHIGLSSNPEGMAQMLRFEEDAILVSQEDGHLKLADELGLAIIGAERQGKLSSPKYVVEEIKDVTPVFVEKVYRRKKDIPCVIAETPRFTIRETSDCDLDVLMRMGQEPDMHPWMRPTNSYDVEKEMLYAYRHNMYDLFEYGMWLIADKENGAIIGEIGFSNQLMDGVMYPDLGYAVEEAYRRMGTALECGQAVLEYMRDTIGCKVVTCHIQEENVPSLSLAEKLGFSVCKKEEKDGKTVIVLKKELAPALASLQF